MAISINPNKLNELFEKFKEGGAYNPGDGTTPEITDSDKALLEALFTKYEKLKNEQENPSGTSGDVFQKILEKFEKDDKAFEAAKKYLSYDVEEYSRAKSINLKRQLSVLRMNIENIEAGTLQVSPVVVLEVSADLVSRDLQGNLGLMFPRCKRIRDDKFGSYINTLEDVENLE